MVTPRPLSLGALVLRAVLAAAPLALLLVASQAAAQPHFRLAGPTLVVDGRPVEVVGAPLDQSPFGSFVLTVPGHGLYVVSDRPFDGARRAGQFDGETLAFTVEGRSLRLRAVEPLLDAREPVDAFVRFTPMRGDGTDGPAAVEVAEYAGLQRRPRPRGAGARDANLDRAFTSRERLAAENRHLAGEVDALQAEMGRLDREAHPVTAGRDRLRGELARLGTERADAAHEQARLDATRAYLEAEHAAFRRDLDAYTEAARRYESERAHFSDDLGGHRRAALEAEHQRLVAERARLDHERMRLDRETRALGGAVGSLTAETARLASERERVADEQARLVRERDAVADEQQRLISEVSALRRSADALDAETQRLRAEGDGLGADLDRRSPAPRRDAEPRSDLDALRAERNALREEATTLRRDLTRLEAELAHRQAAPAPPADRPPAIREGDAAAERDAVAAANGALRREQAELEARLHALQSERDALLAARGQFEEDRAQLEAERDALHREAEALRAELLLHEGALPARPRTAEPAAAEDPRGVPAPSTVDSDAGTDGGSDGSSISLPGFDWGRLQNPEEISALLRDAPYPQDARVARVEGDALVLFATDDTGRVVEAAVAERLGGGLDDVAERLVQAMHFVPPVWDGMPTVLRSQVLVRFER